MKKHTYIICFLATIILLLVWHQAIRKSANNVEVGVLVPLSQDFAWWGDGIRNAIRLTQSRGIAAGVTFIYSDTKCNGKDAVTGIQYLKVRYPGMHMFFVGCDNDLKAIHPFLDHSKDLAFMIGLSDQSLYDSKFPTINLAYRIEYEAKETMRFALDQLGSKKIGILVSSTGIGVPIGQNAAGYIRDHGGAYVLETLQNNEKNPESAILKILVTHPDTIYIHNDIPGMSSILKRLTQLGYKGNRIVYYGGHDQSFIDTAGYDAEGVYVPWMISGTLTTEEQKFAGSYRSMFNQAPFITAYFVYDGLKILEDAVNACRSSSQCIESFFYRPEGFKGLLDQVKYQPNGQVERKFHFQQIRGGTFVDL